MQNTKLQTLWQLTQELKDKRHHLMEKLNTQQSYLDQQQSAISVELGSLRSNSDGLESILHTMMVQLNTLREQWDNQAPAAPDTQALSMEPRFMDLFGQFAAFNGEAGAFQVLLSQASEDTQASFQNLFEQLAEWTQFFQEGHQAHIARQSSADEDNQTIEESHKFLQDYSEDWTQAKTQLLSELESAAPVEADTSQLDALKQEYEGQLQSLSSELESKALQISQLESSQQDKDSEVQESLTRVQHITQEFEELKQSNHELASDLQHLEGQTHKLIELAESFRQAALAAMDDDEEDDEQSGAENSEQASEADSDEDSANHSKAEIVRDTLRKKIAVILRQRFGKAPRKVTSALRDITNNKEMDRLFELSLNCEDLDSYEAELAEA